MPFLNGPDAVKRIREICHDITTGNTNYEDIEAARCLPLDTTQLQKQMIIMPEKIKGLLKPYIIVYSGMCDENSIKTAISQGSDAYMTKPATVKQFKEQIGDKLEPLQPK